MKKINTNTNNNKGKIQYFIRGVKKASRPEEGKDYSPLGAGKLLG